MRTLDRPEPSVHLQRTAPGIVYLSCGLKYEPGLPSLIDYLSRAAQLRPSTTFLAERDASKGWRRLTYSQAARDTAAVASIPPGNRAIDFLSAGGDMIISKTSAPAHAMVLAIRSRAAADANFHQRVDGAALRILRAKQAWGLLSC